MLKIKNIDERELLQPFESRGWIAKEAFPTKDKQWSFLPHYCITFNRVSGKDIGTAILIVREESRDRGYHRVILCYMDYSRHIYDGLVHIKNIENRDEFFNWAINSFEHERLNG